MGAEIMDLMNIDLAGVGSSVANVAIILFSIVFIGGICVVATLMYLKWKKYNEYKCTIWEVDKYGQKNESHDSAGIFIDPKTKYKRFFMKKAGVGLNPDKVPYVPSGASKVVYLLKEGLKNFKFIHPNITNPNITLSVGEEDVNWAINDYERQKRLFDSNKLLQFMPYIAIAFVSIIILIIFIYFFKDFAVLKEVAVALKEGAQAMAQASSGTTVIS